MESDSRQVLDYAPPIRTWTRRRVSFVVGAVALLYLIGYFALRTTHVIMHYQDMEGDAVEPAVGTKVPGLRLFTPLMRVEEKFWYRGDRRPG